MGLLGFFGDLSAYIFMGCLSDQFVCRLETAFNLFLLGFDGFHCYLNVDLLFSFSLPFFSLSLESFSYMKSSAFNFIFIRI